MTFQQQQEDKMASNLSLLAFASISICVVLAIPGGHRLGNVDDKDVQEIAGFAVQEIDGGTNSLLRSKLMKLTKVEKQVVAGINYHMTFDIGETGCRKGSQSLLSSCEFTGSNVRECKVTVWDQPWTNTRRVTDSTCTDKTPEPTAPKHDTHNKLGGDFKQEGHKKLVGGPTKMDQDSNEIKAAAAFAVEDMNSQTNSMYRMVLLDIVKAHRQTVSGFKYKLQAKLGLSTCRNNDKNKGLTIQECPLGADAEVEMCKFEVLQQVWQTPQFKLLKFKCHGVTKTRNHTKPKHATLGGDGHDNGDFNMFQEFKKTYNKVYSSHKEERKRLSYFVANMKKVEKLQHSEKGSATYGVTQFSDMPAAEFRKYYLTPTWDLSYDASLKPAAIPTGPVPDAFDWRDHGAVTPVKNQGQCGSCWAFSTTGNIEGQWALKKKALVPLSEQELVDCDKLDDGCEGGLPSNAYKEIIRLGGLDTETKYPYDAEDEKCTFKVSDARIYINSSVNISSNEADMAAWLAKNGPISIGINANAMQFYTGGVSHPWSFLCNPQSLDHGVLIVGYGVEKGFLSDSPYWIVKNSWGPGWGEKGYYRVYRGDGTCGLNQMATSAIIN